MVGERSITDARRGPRTNPAVVSSRQLVAWLARQRPVHSVAELGLIRLAAEEPGTWHVDPTAADTLRVMQRFDRLMAEVGAAPYPASAAAPAVARARPGVAARPTRKPRLSLPSSSPALRPARRLSKREMRRRERQAQDIAKLVLLVIAALTFPMWMPLVTQIFSDVVTAGVPSP